MDIRIEDFSFSFGNKTIFKNVNLVFEEGKVYSILGKNGTGKTTLLKNILGILSSPYGVIEIDGKRVSELSESELSKLVSYVPQTSGYELDLDVETVVLLGRNPHISSLSKPKAMDYTMAREAIKSVSMEAYSGECFSNLSGGQKQLVLIARAMAQDTKFIVLDEPTSSLDIKNQHEVMKLVKNISREYGKGIIMSIHDPELGYRYCDEGIMIKEGKVLAGGDMNSIFTEEKLKELYELDFEIIDRGMKGKLLNVL